MGVVYILLSEEGKYYIGSTNNLSRRLIQHRVGHTHSTKRLGKFSLIFSQKYPTLNEARGVEYKLKKLKRKDYLNKIISEGVIKIKP